MAVHTGKQPIIFSFGIGFLDGCCKKRLTEQGNIRIIFYVADIQPRIYNLKALFPTTGEMTERLKVHAWKACVRETVPRVRIPLSPPNIDIGKKVFLYDCSGRSCAMEACEPCQVRKEAALSGSLHAPRGCLPCGLTGKPAGSSP